MKAWVRLPGLIAGVAAPVLSIGGQLLGMATWPSYNPFTQTISEMAAGDAPTQVYMNTIFCLIGVATLVVAFYTPAIAMTGRIFIFVSGLSFFGVAAFPLETMAANSSLEHKLSAMVGFILLAAWPLVGWRRDRSIPWVLRPVPSIIATAVMAVFCFWFLAVWANPGTGYVGTMERAAAWLEGIWPLIVVVVLARGQAKRFAGARNA
ncbi:MAG: hypothetical protein RLZZ600_231 [Actinomycetota bacterium]|jgi:hypothetical membrane protein